MTVQCVFCQRIAVGAYDPTAVGDVVSFEPLNPVTPGHRLFVPRRHVPDAAADAALTGQVFTAAAVVAAAGDGAFNLITSAGATATQTVFHLHVHYVPRRWGDGLRLPWTGQARWTGQPR